MSRHIRCSDGGASGGSWGFYSSGISCLSGATSDSSDAGGKGDRMLLPWFCDLGMGLRLACGLSQSLPSAGFEEPQLQYVLWLQEKEQTQWRRPPLWSVPSREARPPLMVQLARTWLAALCCCRLLHVKQCVTLHTKRNARAIPEEYIPHFCLCTNPKQGIYNPNLERGSWGSGERLHSLAAAGASGSL